MCWRNTELTSIFSKYTNICFKESIQQTFYGLAGLRNQKKKKYNKNKFTHAFWMPYDGRIINILQEKKLTMARVSVLWVYLCSHHQSQSYIRQKLVLQQAKCYIKCFISVIKIKMKKRLCPTWLYIYIYRCMWYDQSYGWKNLYIYKIKSCSKIFQIGAFPCLIC